MEQHNYLGVYLTPEGTYAAVLSGRDTAAGLKCFFVPAGDNTDPGTPVLTAAVRDIVQQAGRCDQVSFAIRSNLINQYFYHSDFADAKQIESTIRFDAEEVAASDANALAVTYEITNSNPTGSEITLYTANRQTLTDILLDVQSAGQDPSFMEPDVVCLTRCLEKIESISSKGKMYLLVFGKTCYLITPVNEGYAPKVRMFLLPEASDKTVDLARQVVLTAAGIAEGVTVKTVVVTGGCEGLDKTELNKRTGMTVESLDLVRQLNLDIPPQMMGGQCNGFLFACGAVLAFAGRVRRSDFRRDFMPYQGQRKILQRSLQVVSVSVTVLLIAVALFFQVKSWRHSKDIAGLRDKLAAEFSTSMYGAKPPRNESMASKLKRELNTVRLRAAGNLDEGMITAKLTYILEAINTTPKTVNIGIKTVTVGEKTVTVNGDTDSRNSTRALLDAMKKHKRLEVFEERFNISGNRDEFYISIKIKEG